MAYPSNDIELQLDLSNKMTIVIDSVASQLTEKLKDIIEKNVYEVYTPVAYTRTFEFLNSWYSSIPRVIGNYVETYIAQDTTMLSNGSLNNHVASEYKSEINQSISNHSGLQNGVENLAMAIEKGNKYYRYPVKNMGNFERPFWNEFEQYISINLDRLIKIEMQKVGLYVG